ncbi:hypothetical protein OHA21_49210 [Actinoplanes sp. NBC_00393]|uniref:hypothetical protein n=1 Tax=Actinoplanes sp. NBC_00393 TaxID=2975953 RepID=UPI002E1E4AF8
MRAKGFVATAALGFAAAGVLAVASPASAADYYCEYGPRTISSGKQAEARCKHTGRQVRIKAECDWSPFNIYSNAFGTSYEYRKTNGSCSQGIESAYIAWV